jgi:ferric-dicitrate binding protein FerR (iron transport regulator)
VSFIQKDKKTYLQMKDNSLNIARFLLNDLTRKEEEDLDQWKSTSKENASFVELLQAFWNHSTEEKQNEDLDNARERLCTRISTQEQKSTRKTILFRLSRVAAIFILVVSVSGLSIYFGSKIGTFNQNWVEVSTEPGQQSKVTLPDGTLVWLNAETTLKYQQNNNVRKVNLSGEGYFEVMHSSSHPFIVEVGNTSIKVLGTKFNVSHYPDSKITEASLLSGKITLTVNETGQEVKLNPGERVIYQPEQKLLSKSEYKVQNEILWKQGILYFENKPFNDLIHELARYYGVKFNYNPEVFNNIHYSGSIDNLEINKVLEFIKLTIPINYEVNNRTIELKLK